MLALTKHIAKHRSSFITLCKLSSAKIHLFPIWNDPSSSSHRSMASVVFCLGMTYLIS